MSKKKIHPTVVKMQKFMKENGDMPIYKMAAMLGVPSVTISRWINKKCDPSSAYQQLLENLMRGLDERFNK